MRHLRQRCRTGGASLGRGACSKVRRVIPAFIPQHFPFNLILEFMFPCHAISAVPYLVACCLPFVHRPAPASDFCPYNVEHPRPQEDAP